MEPAQCRGRNARLSSTVHLTSHAAVLTDHVCEHPPLAASHHSSIVTLLHRHHTHAQTASVLQGRVCVPPSLAVVWAWCSVQMGSVPTPRLRVLVAVRVRVSRAASTTLAPSNVPPLPSKNM